MLASLCHELLVSNVKVLFMASVYCEHRLERDNYLNLILGFCRPWTLAQGLLMATMKYKVQCLVLLWVWLQFELVCVDPADDASITFSLLLESEDWERDGDDKYCGDGLLGCIPSSVMAYHEHSVLVQQCILASFTNSVLHWLFRSELRHPSWTSVLWAFSFNSPSVSI